MAMLDDWYGPERAQRMRRERRRFAEAPTAAQVPNLSPEMKSLLAARMQMALSALKTAYGSALSIASNWPEINWKTALATAYMPWLAPLMAVSTPTEVKENVLSALRSTMATQIAMREAEMARVLAGQLSIAAWMESVKETGKGIANILKGMKEDSTANNLIDRLNDVWLDVSTAIVWISQKAREVPKQVDTFKVPLIVGGVLLGGFILYQYATAPLKLLPRAPTMAGYRGRRRRARR